MRPIIALATALVLALAFPVVSLAQGGTAFSPLPPAVSAPPPTPTPTESPATNARDTSRSTLYVVGIGLLILFVAIGYTITRDARRTLPELGIAADRPRDESSHRQRRDAKERARQKARAARAARKTTKRRAR